MSYEVTTPVYTGPFDLLLHLITKRQVEIYEISLSEIVDGYVAEIDRMEELNLEIATEFLLIAATLIELKSVRLLPSGAEFELDEELSLYERRDLLIARILDAKAFKDASKVIQECLVTGSRFAPRVAGIEEPFVHLCPDLLAQVTPERLAEMATRVFEPRPEPRVEIDHIHKIEITVGEVMRDMAEDLELRRRANFRDLTIRCRSRIEVAVHFLAMLELYKQNMIDIEQFTTFGEVTVIWAPVEQLLDWDAAGAEWEDEAITAGPGAPAPSGRDGTPAAHAIPMPPADEEPADDADLVAEIAAELGIDLDSEDGNGDDDLLDRALLDNSDLLEDAEELLGQPARPEAWKERQGDASEA